MKNRRLLSIKGGSPGHVVLIVDMAENDKGEKIFYVSTILICCTTNTNINKS